MTGPLAEPLPDLVEDHPMVPFTADLFAVRRPEAAAFAPVTVHARPTGERCPLLGASAPPRVG